MKSDKGRYGRWSYPLPFILLLSFILCGCATTYREYDVSLNAHALEAAVLFKEGDYEKALNMYQKAIRSYEGENNQLGVLFCLERMGWLQREIGQYGAALQLFQKAYPIALRLNGDAAEIDADLGDVYLFSGDEEKAREHYERTLATLEKFVFKTSYSRPPKAREITSIIRKCKAIIHARDNLGILHYFAGRYKEALQHLQAARKLIRKIFKVAGHPLYGMYFKLDSDIYEGKGFCHTIMGATYGETGRFKKAWQHFDAGKSAFEKGDKRLGLIVNQALRFKIEFLAPGKRTDRAKFSEYEHFLDRAERSGATEVIWRMCYEIGRALIKEKRTGEARNYLARAIDALELTRSRLREDAVKKMFATSVQDVYMDMINVLFEMKRFEEGFDYLERSKARAFLDMLAGRSLKAKKSVDPLLVKKEREIQRRIDITERRLKHISKGERERTYQAYKQLLRERKNILRTIRNQSLEFAAATAVTTVPAGRIAGRLRKGTALLSYVLDKEGSVVWFLKDGRISAASIKAGSSELGELVADYRQAVASNRETRISDLGQRLSNLLIKPLLERLQGADKLYIVPSKSLHYLSFSSLPLSKERFLVQDFTISILPSASSLFFMDKTVTHERGTLFALGNPERDHPAMDLKYAEEEVLSISRHFPRSVVLTGKDARESALKERDLIDTGIIHFAGHGHYNEKSPLKSAVLLARDQANDGNLETIEIFSLTMNPRLVVLSACKTGIGSVEGGDEVQSLNRAFLYAGAGSVMASLWNVSDQSTYLLMKKFYEALHRKSAAHALREAQILVMKSYPSPFYWAAFYLTGGIE
jgi:CHAT domain-containing protein